MASEIEKSRFNDLLKELSKEDYPGNKFNWLRCLLFDNLNIDELLPAHRSGLQLFSKLREGNSISFSNVEILLEIAEITGQHAPKMRIDKYKKETGDRYNGNTGPRLTEYRKALYKSLRQVGLDELPDVVAFYQLDHEGFTNMWDCVFHLEKHKLLSSLKRKTFAELLNPTAKVFLDCLDEPTLKTNKGISTVLSPPTVSQTSTPEIKIVPATLPSTSVGRLTFEKGTQFEDANSCCENLAQVTDGPIRIKDYETMQRQLKEEKANLDLKWQMLKNEKEKEEEREWTELLERRGKLRLTEESTQFVDMTCCENQAQVTDEPIREYETMQKQLKEEKSNLDLKWQILKNEKKEGRGERINETG